MLLRRRFYLIVLTAFVAVAAIAAAGGALGNEGGPRQSVSGVELRDAPSMAPSEGSGRAETTSPQTADAASTSQPRLAPAPSPSESAPVVADAATSTSVATSASPGSVSETVTNGNATAETAAQVLPGSSDGLSISVERTCAPGGTCASSTAVTVSTAQGSVAYASSSSSSTANGGSSAAGAATAGDDSCAPVPPALKTEFGPDGTRRIKYEYSSGGGCATTETQVR